MPGSPSPSRVAQGADNYRCDSTQRTAFPLPMIQVSWDKYHGDNHAPPSHSGAFFPNLSRFLACQTLPAEVVLSQFTNHHGT